MSVTRVRLFGQVNGVVLGSNVPITPLETSEYFSAWQEQHDMTARRLAQAALGLDSSLARYEFLSLTKHSDSGSLPDAEALSQLAGICFGFTHEGQRYPGCFDLGDQGSFFHDMRGNNTPFDRWDDLVMPEPYPLMLGRHAVAA